jgi:hypothetical protein
VKSPKYIKEQGKRGVDQKKGEVRPTMSAMSAMIQVQEGIDTSRDEESARNAATVTKSY